MWITEISKIMYEKCMDNDKKEYWSLITNNQWIYWYCKNVNDRPELYNKLTDNKWIYHYCYNIKQRKELTKKLVNSTFSSISSKIKLNYIKN